QRIVFYRGNGLPVALSRDGKTVACDFDGSGLHLYDVATGKELPGLQQGNNNNNFGGRGVGAVDFAADGVHLAVMEFDGRVRIYDWTQGKEVRTFGGPGNNGGIFGGTSVLQYSPDGKVLVTMGLELDNVNNMVKSSLRLWDPSNGTEIRTIGLSQQ